MKVVVPSTSGQLGRSGKTNNTGVITETYLTYFLYVLSWDRINEFLNLN